MRPTAITSLQSRFSRERKPSTTKSHDNDSSSDSGNISQLSVKMDQRRLMQRRQMKLMIDIFEIQVLLLVVYIVYKNEEDEEYHLIRQTILNNMRDISQIQQDLDEEYGQLYQKHQISQDNTKNTYIEVVIMDQFQEVKAYQDNLPLLYLRKKIMLIFTQISVICDYTIHHSIFEGIILLVIIWNSIMLSLDDPTTDVQTDDQDIIENSFLVIYTIEMLLKIFAMGFVMDKKAYLKDIWNIIDFTIVLSGYLPLVIGMTVVNLSALRSLRILRPLRTINKIKPLRDIVQALFSAIGLLRDSIIILVFFYTIFAIGGLQLFMGILKRRCFSQDYGMKDTSSDQICSDDSTCSYGFICGKMLENPNLGLTNFDDFGSAFLQVYIVCTMEGWSSIMQVVCNAYSPWVAIYFIAIVLIGAFFIVNLTLAIIKVNFSEAQDQKDNLVTEAIDSKEHWDLSKIRELGVYQKKILDLSRQEKEEQKQYGIQSISYKMNKQNFHMEGISVRYYNSIDNNQSDLTSPHLTFKRETLKPLQLSPLPLLPILPVLQYSKPPINTQIFKISPSKLVRMDPKPMIISKNGIKFAGISGMNQINKVSSIIEQVEKSLITNDNNMGKSVKMENNYYRGGNVLPNDTMKLSMKQSNSFKQKSNNNSNSSVDSPKSQKKRKQSSFAQSFVFDDEEMFALNNPPQSPRKKTTFQLKQKQDMKASKRSRQSPTQSKSPPKLNLFQLVQTISPRQSKPNSPRFQKINSVKQVKVNSPRLLGKNTKILDDEVQQEKMNPVSLFQRIQKHGGVEGIVKNQLAIEGLKQSINSDSSGQQDKDNKIPLNSDLFYSNLHDLGLQDIFVAEPKQIQEIVEEKDDESPQFNINTNKRKQRNFIRQEVRRITIRQISSEKGELTKEQQLLKESLLSSNKLITGLIPQKRLIESFTSEPVVLVKKQQRENARRLQKESQYRANMKIKLVYSDETDRTKPKSITQQQSTIRSSRKSSVFSRKQNQSYQKSSKDTSEKKSNYLALTTGLNTKMRRQQRPVEIELNYKNLCQLFIQSDSNLDEEENKNKEENKEENKDNLQTAFQQKVNKDDAEQIYHQIRKDDVYKNNGQITINWSGYEVLIYDDYNYLQDIRLVNNIILNMNVNSDSKTIWIPGLFGVVVVMRKHIKQFVQSKTFDTIIMSSVVINTLILSLDGLVPNQQIYILDTFNFYFTLIFTADMGLKLIALGRDYLLDKINIFDGLIVTLSLVELTILGGSGKGSSLQAFRAVRIFRVFRVLRVTRLIRSLRFMAVILDVISRTMQSFIYIFLLMILFLYIFTLLGMSLFGGSLNNNTMRQNFDSFFDALICSFQILTIENWNDILRAALLSGINAFITLAYLVTWIFIGNWVFLNLFLSILLEGFEKRQMDEEVLEMEKEMEVMQNLNFDETLLISQHTSQPARTNNRRLSIFAVKEKTGFQYFVEVGLCENSLMLFSFDNPFRRICYRIVNDVKFEAVIFTLIVFTSLQLVLDTYLNFDEISLILNITFTILFTVEAFMKITAFGFAFSPCSYLTESWSQLDFFIVSLSWFDLGMQFSSSNLNLAFIRVLRLFRTLRPLRFISHNISMKLVVTALLESVSGIFNVAIVVLLVWMMFAILGMNLMAGKLNYCNSTEDINVYEWRQNDCYKASPGAYWNTYDMNFDNIISGMITLFVMSTLEGWPDYLFNFMDADDSGPIKNNSSFFFWYMMVFILVGSFFLLNLFIGVISLSYNLATKKAKNEYLSDDQSNWIEIQRLIVETRPFFPNQFSPQNKLRAFFFKILKLRGFDAFIMACIISNIVVMAMAHENSSEQFDSILQNLNLAFTFIFISEAIIKLLAFGITGYFNNNWNQFDFFVVVTSIVDFLLDLFGSGIQGLKVGPQIARVFRVLRVSRLLRLIKSFQGLQKLIQTAIFSLPKLLNVLSLLMLNFFIFSVLACQLFGSISEGKVIGPDFNFLNFSQAFLLLIRCATGENWYIVMFDTTRVKPHCVQNVSCGSPYNVFFFIIYIVTVQFIMLNLFVLVILQQFEENYINPDNPLQNFADLENVFLDTWVKFTESSKGEKLIDKKLVPLLMQLKKPLGMDSKVECTNSIRQWKEHNTILPSPAEEKSKVDKFISILKKDAAKQIMQMGICTDNEGFVFYNQVLFHFMKNHLFNTTHIFDSNPKGLHILQKEETISNKKIQAQNKTPHLRMEIKPVNPVVQLIFVSLSFKVWSKFNERFKRKHMKQPEDDYFSSSYASSDNEDERTDNILFQVRERTEESEEQEQPQRQYVAIPNTDIYQDEDYMYEGNPADSG